MIRVRKRLPLTPMAAIFCVVLSLVLRALVMPGLVRGAELAADGAYVYRIVVRCDGAASATLYNAMGQYCRTVTFSDGEGVLTVRAGGYILCAGDAQVRFALARDAAVWVEGGDGWTDGTVLRFTPQADSCRMI